MTLRLAPQKRNPRRWHLFPFLALGLVGLFFVPGFRASSASLITATPEATPTFDTRRLEPPPTKETPGQEDEGALYYWGVCIACHGDQGQGLTEEWRASYAPPERDCWRSGCHGSDYPENSFEIPVESGAPGIAEAGKLAQFSNAFELQKYIFESMPWQNPGSMTPEDAWGVTAYVLKLHGTQPEGVRLEKTNASAIPIHRSVSAPTNELPGALALAAALSLAAVGMTLQASKRTGKIATSSHPTFVHHLHPPSIPALQARFRYTLGAGGLAVFFSLALFFTGLLEMYYYTPSRAGAAISIEIMATLVPFGNLVRNLHFWSAQALVVVTTIHLLRVIFTGAYAPPRRLNYLLGLGLLVLVLLLDFTGYVLRWDEGIRWALVVGANLLKTIPLAGEDIYRFIIGGTQPGPATLTRFYAWHIFGLAGAAAFLMVWHAFRVRRDGGIAVPAPAERTDNTRITRFELVRREILAMVIAGVLLWFVSLLLPAPINQPIAETNLTAGDSRAPWFFLWVQQMLKWGNPFLFGVLAPVLVVVALGLLPYLLPNPKPSDLGRWFPQSNLLAQALAASIILAILALTILGSIRS